MNQRMWWQTKNYLVWGAVLLVLAASNATAGMTATAQGMSPDSVADTPLPAEPSYFLIGIFVAIICLFLIIAAIRRRGQKIDVEVHLLVMSGEREGTKFRIEKTKVKIGSREDNDLVIPDDHVARHHALLVYKGGVFTLTDLNTLHGTFVGGKRIEQIELGSDRRINLGGEVDLELVIS